MSIKSVERDIENRVYHYKKKKQWLRHMKKRLDGQKTKILSKDQEKEIKEYYRPFINLHETMGHEWYTQKTGFFSCKYIPDWVWHGYIDPYYNDIDAAAKMENKCFFENMFSKCKQPENIAYRANGIWYTNVLGVISYKKVLELIKKEKSVFIKQANISCGGGGVKKISGKDIEKQANVIIDSIKYDIVIQKPIEQSLVMAKINPSSVNTIRVLTILSENGVKVYSMAIRFGVGSSYVDNACSGGLMVGLSPNGRLGKYAYYRNGEKCSVHPTTGIKFSDVIIPNVEDIIQFVEKLAPQVPYFRMVSWDIVLDKNNEPMLLEANFREGGIDIHQLTNGPIFGEDTEMILKEVFNKSKEL